MVTAVFPIESPPETREARQPVHRPQWGGLESPRVLGGLWARSFDTPSEITKKSRKRETRDVGVQISGTHTDECTSSRPGDWVIPGARAIEASSSQSVSEGEGSASSERKAIYYDRWEMGGRGFAPRSVLSKMRIGIFLLSPSTGCTGGTLGSYLGPSKRAN